MDCDIDYFDRILYLMKDKKSSIFEINAEAVDPIFFGGEKLNLLIKLFLEAIFSNSRLNEFI